VAKRAPTPNWRAWLARWDEQQESFNPSRERRFDAMFDVLAAALPRRFTALDLGCGPGSLTARLLRRFPAARVVAVDFDPVVLQVGRGALSGLGDRITWVDANLGAPGWTMSLPRRRFDAAVSTTALHWLRRPELRRLYRDLAPLIRPRGVVLNGDYLPWGAQRPRLGRLAERARRNAFGGKSLQSEWAGWNRWWRDIEKEAALQDEFVLRKERFPTPHGSSRDSPVPLEFHLRALRRAGFRDVDVVWQEMENRVLVGFR